MVCSNIFIKEIIYKKHSLPCCQEAIFPSNKILIHATIGGPRRKRDLFRLSAVYYFIGRRCNSVFSMIQSGKWNSSSNGKWY
ncbi:hypothetical protein OIU74_013367 [Salix koriyanagi]|uniref:Uncharacterized protein n=1 Tax=Salix koriyanagi TaxID=2511006 RepID=A0A9Q0Q903_9ROSI|nr:hypothetical protein OIU74_013367 [Salix koriyanagi]